MLKGKKNISKAKEYFEKAADMGSANGYSRYERLKQFSILYVAYMTWYSLASIYRDGAPGVPKNIPLAVHLYSLSASQGNVRALALLGEALLDTESWIGVYSREEASDKAEAGWDSHVKEGHNPAPSTPSGLTDGVEVEDRDDMSHQDDDNNKDDDNDDLLEDELARWGYNATRGISVIIPASNLVIRLPSPLRPDCSAALPMLKHVAEYSYRGNDITKEALNLYVTGDIWGALELYEEAADLGIHSGQENAAFIYKIIAEKKCKHRKDESSPVTFFSGMRSHINQVIASMRSLPFFGRLLKNFVLSTDDQNDDDDASSSYRGYSKAIHSPHCQNYFQDMSTRRWIQVANGGDVDAIREIAQMNEGVGHKKGNMKQNYSKAALLYGHAAATYGDISSVMALAAMIQHGSMSGMLAHVICWLLYFVFTIFFLLVGIEKNLTLASKLYGRAGELESVYSRYGMSWATTLGVAPKLAASYVEFERWMDFIDSVDYSQLCDQLQAESIPLLKSYGLLVCMLFAILYYIWGVL